MYSKSYALYLYICISVRKHMDTPPMVKLTPQSKPWKSTPNNQCLHTYMHLLTAIDRLVKYVPSSICIYSSSCVHINFEHTFIHTPDSTDLGFRDAKHAPLRSLVRLVDGSRLRSIVDTSAGSWMRFWSHQLLQLPRSTCYKRMSNRILVLVTI